MFERGSSEEDAGVADLPDLESMLASVRNALESALGDRPTELLPMAAYQALLPTEDAREIPKCAAAMVRILRRLGYGIEPNPQTERPAFTKSTHLGVYRIEAKSTEVRVAAPAPNPQKFAALLVFAGSDGGRISPASRAAVHAVLARRYELSPNQRRQLQARTEWQFLHPASYAALRPALGNPLDWNADGVDDDVLAVVSADGAPLPQRIKELAKIYKLLGLDVTELHNDLHRVSTGGARRSTEGNTSELDPQKLERVLQATDTIASLLDDVFSEQAAPSPLHAEPNRADGDPLLAFMTALAERKTWSAGELGLLAADSGLMVSGAIETINDRAIERGLDAPIECDDSLCEIDTQTLKELLAHD